MSAAERRPVPGNPNYEVDDRGNVYPLGREKPMYLRVDADGYHRVNLTIAPNKKRHSSVHRLVCEAFHGPAPAPGMHAAHANSIRNDNRKENLSWKTPAENNADKPAGLSINQGLTNGRVKLSPEQVLAIREANAPRRELARRFSISISQITCIQAGKSWRHL